MQLLKASARLPALADIAAWRSHSTASWLAVLLPGLSPAAGGALLAAPVGDGAGAAHAAKSISAASNPIFMIHPCSAISGDAPLFVAFPASGANTFFCGGSVRIQPGSLKGERFLAEFILNMPKDSK